MTEHCTGEIRWRTGVRSVVWQEGAIHSALCDYSCV